MQDLTVTVVQTSLAWEDPASGRAHIDRHLASVNHTDLVVLPEVFTTGFTMSAQDCAEEMNGPSVAWMRAHAGRMNAVVTGSLIVRDGDTYRNRLIWAGPDDTLQWYDKRHLFRFAGEHERYTAGERRLVVELKGWKVAPFVCYDLRFPVWCRYPTGCDLMLFVANWPSPRHNAWSTLLQARAIENQCYLAGVNRVGKDGKGLDYLGGSVVLDYLGKALADCADAEAVRTVTLSRGPLEAYRRKFPAYMDADLYELQ